MDEDDDLTTDRDLDAVAKAGMPILPTATFLAVVCELGKQQKVGAEQVQLDFNRMQRHYDLLGELMHKARKLGIRLLVGTDTATAAGSPAPKAAPPVGLTATSQAIVAATRDNALAVGLDGKVGQIAPDQLADITVWNKDPIADIAILQDNKNLSFLVKDGRVVDLYPRDEMLVFQQAAE